MPIISFTVISEESIHKYVSSNIKDMPTLI